jgi:GH15 family glucan-1,4-alpha-glucosidase
LGKVSKKKNAGRRSTPAPPRRAPRRATAPAGGPPRRSTRPAAGRQQAAGATTAPRLDHGAIGNGRVLALVAPTSAIEWLCLPDFSSPSVFARLLDAEKGGVFRILSGGREIKGQLEYVTNTNVLRGVFKDGRAAWEVIDFAPRIPEGLDVRAPVEIIRLVRPLEGSPRISIDFDPRPDYARATPDCEITEEGLRVSGGGQRLTLASSVPMPYILGKRTFTLDQPAWFVLRSGGFGETPTLASVNRALELTVAGWQAWARTCALPDFAQQAVLRSALCLKLHAFHDTGAIIAAATTSIPEALGTERNWDYRFCWLRDAAFVVEALRRLSYLGEGEQFLRFLREVAETGPLQPLYGISGERDLEEKILDHLAGFGGTKPVRIGNAAATQKQNDLMGEMVLCLATLLEDPRLVVDGSAARYLGLITRLVEEAIEAAPTDDTGIWEYRSMLKPHTFSRAMCWAAIHRGAGLARHLGQPKLAARWDRIAAREQKIILKRGYNAELGFFTQGLDGTNADASNLLLPSIGLIDARDPRFVSTVDAYERRLGLGNGLLLRYENPDDFGMPSTAFTICAFWMAEALALVGRLDEAVERFQALMKYANPLGLFSEDVDPATGALLGNFPQAYTHVGLIHAAITIGELLDARDGRVRAWA